MRPLGLVPLAAALWAGAATAPPTEPGAAPTGTEPASSTDTQTVWMEPAAEAPAAPASAPAPEPPVVRAIAPAGAEETPPQPPPAPPPLAEAPVPRTERPLRLCYVNELHAALPAGGASLGYVLHPHLALVGTALLGFTRSGDPAFYGAAGLRAYFSREEVSGYATAQIGGGVDLDHARDGGPMGTVAIGLEAARSHGLLSFIEAGVAAGREPSQERFLVVTRLSLGLGWGWKP